MAWVSEKFFHVALSAPESFHRFTACRIKRFLNIIEIIYHFKTAPAAAISCLNGNRQAMFLSKFSGFLPIIDGVGGAWGQWRAHFFGYAACGNLIAEQIDCLWLRPNPDHAGVTDRARKISVLR